MASTLSYRAKKIPIPIARDSKVISAYLILFVKNTEIAIFLD